MCEPQIVATDHAAVQHIFGNTDIYGQLGCSRSRVFSSLKISFTAKSPSFRPPIAALIGKGLVWAEGDDHKKQRRILAGAFS
jgi:cytochrome P450